MLYSFHLYVKITFYVFLLDWRADGYRWREVGGPKPFKVNQVTCKKHKFFSVIGRDGENKPVVSDCFHRIVFIHPHHPLRRLVMYTGDQTIQPTLLPHGNASLEDSLKHHFVPTRPSNLNELKCTTDKPTVEYVRLRCEATEEASHLNEYQTVAPRNIKQIANAQEATRKQSRISQDALYNLFKLKEECRHFVKVISVGPDNDLRVLLCHDRIVEKVKGLLNRSDIPHILACFDTTFDVVMFMYISFLYIKWEEFHKGPGILVAALMHERKTKSAHKFFFDGFNDVFPRFRLAKNLYVMTDGEAAITSQIDEYWPELDRYRCWRHIFKNVEMELRRLGVKDINELGRYEIDIKSLFEQSDETHYYKELCSFMDDQSPWSNVILF